MFSAGQQAVNPTTAALNTMTTMNVIGMGAQTASSMLNMIGSCVSQSVMAEANVNQWNSQQKVADTQMGIQLDYLKTQEGKAEVTIAQTQLRNDAKEDRMEKEAKFKEVEAQSKEERRTRESTRVSLKDLDKAFSRTTRSYGRPAAPLPEDHHDDLNDENDVFDF